MQACSIGLDFYLRLPTSRTRADDDASKAVDNFRTDLHEAEGVDLSRLLTTKTDLQKPVTFANYVQQVHGQVLNGDPFSGDLKALRINISIS